VHLFSAGNPILTFRILEEMAKFMSETERSKFDVEDYDGYTPLTSCLA